MSDGFIKPAVESTTGFTVQDRHLYLMLHDAWRKAYPHLSENCVKWKASRYFDASVNDSDPTRRTLRLKISALRKGDPVGKGVDVTLSQLWYGLDMENSNHENKICSDPPPPVPPDWSSIVLSKQDEDDIRIAIKECFGSLPSPNLNE